MAHLVLSSYEVDCDGNSNAYQRVDVPDCVAAETLLVLDSIAEWSEKIKWSKRTETIVSAFENDTLDALNKERDYAERELSRRQGELRGIMRVINRHLEDTGESCGSYRDWHPISSEEWGS